MTSRGLEEQVALLMQGTEYGDAALQSAMAAELRQRLLLAEAEGRKLRVYCGFDPRTSDLHLGHTIPMRKMRQFQELGHEVIFVVGSFTSLIGDPSDKDKLRPRLSEEQVRANAETYAEQAFKILDRNATRIEYNHAWLGQLTLRDAIPLASTFTLQQFLTRDTFRKRWENDDPIYLHETFYALVQAYDAYHLRADVQIGGTDQLFNIVTAGRKLMEALGVLPNIGVIMGLLPGTDGFLKMSKSLGNHISLNTTPEDMFGKVMSVPDSAMSAYFRLVTRWEPAGVAARLAEVKAGAIHPMEAKLALAREIVAIYHGEAAVGPAEGHFKRVYQERASPDSLEDLTRIGETLQDLVASIPSVSSRSEARRLIEQRGVRIDGEVWADPKMSTDGAEGKTIQIGPTRFFRIVPPRAG
ncbi:MAG TPA: tyrosine--tRNA ligase [Anaerolineales bacterium]|nr:tyrosine--tRNA ligase [Anaerolineales bacterium]